MVPIKVGDVVSYLLCTSPAQRTVGKVIFVVGSLCVVRREMTGNVTLERADRLTRV